jgi:hypothetical protein
MTEPRLGWKDETKNEGQPRPYPPSWVDHLNGWVDGCKCSSLYFYVGLGLVLVAVQLAVLWIEGAFSLGTIFPAQLFIPAMISLFLAAIYYLDTWAEAALKTLRPALTASEVQRERLLYQLTTLPAIPTLLSSIVVVGAIFLLGQSTGETESSIEALAASPTAQVALTVMYWIGWWVLGAFLYHTIHQLRAINRAFTRHTRVHLFATSPLYAFSGVTAFTAAILAIAAYGWTALNPDNLADPVAIVVVFLITALAFVVFAWPLLGTRRLLAREKAQWLDQVSLRVEAVFAEIHLRIDSGDHKEVEELTKTIAVLESQRDTLKGISTWPWQPETLRTLVTALLLPLLLWIIQYILQFVLGA